MGPMDPERRLSDAALDEQPPLFLSQGSYRQRRLMDAVRLLPLLGVFLIGLPVLWAPGMPSGGTARGFVYLFAIWVLLIILAGVLARRLSRPLGDAHEAPPPGLGPDPDTGTGRGQGPQ